jgi:hypothetical protein
MTTRTFRQLGQAFGPGPVTVIATIDDIEVFNGTVAATNSVAVSAPDDIQPLIPELLFTWTEDVFFEGTRRMKINVSGGTLLLRNTYANYGVAFDGNPIVRYAGLTGGPELFTPVYAHSIDAPPDPCCQDTECENRPTLVHDPLSDVSINGISKTREYVSSTDGKVLPGQFCWLIPDAGEFTATVNIFAGAE